MSSVADFARVLLPRSSTDGALAMLSAYFDDTGTHEGSPVIGFAGLIGNEHIWSAFEPLWKAKIAEPIAGKPALKKFEMADCVACRGEFATYSRPESDALIHDLRQIIIDSGVWGYAVAISQRDWEEIIVPSQAILLWGDAEAFCFRDCVAKMLMFIHYFSASDRELSLIFDNRPQRTEINEKIYKEYQRLPHPYNANLLGVSFLDAASFVPIQGADMFAWEYFTHIRTLIETGDPREELDPRPHAKQFFDSGGRFHMNLVDRAVCEKFASVLAVSSGV